jgi:hypothetical protein
MNLDRLKLITDSANETLRSVSGLKEMSEARSEVEMSALSNLSKALREMRESLGWNVNEIAQSYEGE